MEFKDKLQVYYRLAKPGIIYGNAVTALAGFFLASKSHIDISLMLFLIIGLSLAIASACIFNNYIDRGIDAKMARTKKRALASGLISPIRALTAASILGIIGILILAVHVNALVVGLVSTAFIFYVIIYGWAKRNTVHSTVIGSVPGAIPPVAGYCAVTNHLDGGALILFLILVFWQMPHFYAIAMYRFDDYKAAGLPVLPVKKGFRQTKIQILVYIAAFIAAVAALRVFGYAGNIYLVVVVLVGLYWLWLGLKGFNGKDDRRWARKMFFYSLIVNLTMSVMIAANALLVKI